MCKPILEKEDIPNHYIGEGSSALAAWRWGDDENTVKRDEKTVSLELGRDQETSKFQSSRGTPWFWHTGRQDYIYSLLQPAWVGVYHNQEWKYGGFPSAIQSPGSLLHCHAPDQCSPRTHPGLR